MQKISGQAVFTCPACKGSIHITLNVQPAPAQQPQPAPAAAPAEKSVSPGSGSLKERLAQALNALPPMPRTMDDIRGLMADSQARPADIAKVLEGDPSVSEGVLRLTGMSLHGDPLSVRSVQQAIGTLGAKTLSEFITLACAFPLLGGELKGYGLQAGELWQHSLAVAYCSRALAAGKSADLAEEAFSAGLFHDCGKLLLDGCVGERREEFLACVREEKKSFLDAERQILGFDHPQVAADVCVKWRIPKRQAVAIALHHTPSRFVQNDLASILHAADATAMMSGIGSGIDGLMYAIDEKAMDSLKTDGDRIGVLMAEAAGYVKRVMASF